MSVMIGIDPHKRSHTAVVINSDEVEIDAIRVRASICGPVSDLVTSVVTEVGAV